MPIHQLMYISTVVGTVSTADCREIARISAINNGRENVSGLLLFNSRRFLQVLEGPHDAVKRTYDRIARDPRHRAVVILRDTMVEAREFGDWAMAFDDPATSSQSLRGLVDALLRTAGPSTRAHFMGSADLHRAG